MVVYAYNQCIKRADHTDEQTVSRRSTHTHGHGTGDTRLDMLHTVSSILDQADVNLSWSQLPSRSRMQHARKLVNTVIATWVPPQNR